MADEEIEVPERGYNTRDVRTLAEPRKPRRKWPWIALLSLVIAPAAILGIWAAITLGYTYSNGERVGYVQKFSKKGWICKTWEGELAMTTVPGTAPQLFLFSVRDDKVAAQVEDIMRTRDGRVSVTYEEHKGVPTSCFGETDYFVTEARPVGPNMTPGAAGTPAPGTATAVPTAPAAPLPAPRTP